MALPFDQLLAALNSKRYPAFSKPPDFLLKVANSIKVSRRLALYEAEFKSSPGIPLPPPPPSQGLTTQIHWELAADSTLAMQCDLPRGDISRNIEIERVVSSWYKCSLAS